MKKLSCVIITYNEEKYIERTLLSVVDIVDEIIVVDSFSTDKTLDICKKYNATIFQRSFIGFTDQKNFAIEQASNDYVLALDGDEALSEELKKSILDLNYEFLANAYSFNILNNYCGQWIKHSNWYPGTKVRLFNRKKASWYSPTNLHETVKLENNQDKTIHLKGDLLHWAYDSYSEHHQKNDRYTDLVAKNYVKYKNKKVSVISVIVNPFWKFFKNYFFSRGFLDGFNGFVICTMASYSTFLKYIKIIELQRNNKK